MNEKLGECYAATEIGSNQAARDYIGRVLNYEAGKTDIHTMKLLVKTLALRAARAPLYFAKISLIYREA